MLSTTSADCHPASGVPPERSRESAAYRMLLKVFLHSKRAAFWAMILRLR